MASRGSGRRGGGQSNNPLQPTFDQQVFNEAIGVVTATIAQASAATSTIAQVSAATATIVQTSATAGQEGLSNLQRFKAHHPPTFKGGRHPLIDDHLFQQVEKILDAIEITSDATRIRLLTFQLEGESQVWWDWVRALTDLEAMAWEELCGLFMEKYFSASTRHPKAMEFLELRQGTMIVL